MGAVTLTVAAAVLLLGAGCQKQGYRPNSGKLDQGPSPSRDASSSTLPITWSEYRSEKLGITIPYPEGWHASELGTSDQGSGLVVEFYDRQPIPESDMPARVQVQVSDATVEQVRATFPEITEESTVRREEYSVLRIVHPRDVEPATDETPRLAYLWTSNGHTFVVDGAVDDPTFEEIVNRLLRKDGEP